MKSEELLSRNHDTHFHSQLSDGFHSVDDVVLYVSRWQVPPRWAGISDHSPKKIAQLKEYLETLRSIQAELREKDDLTLLAGMEWEWNPQSPEINGDELEWLDYVISSYHGMGFSQSEEVEAYFKLIVHNKYSDIIGHPDKFLGKVDAASIHWEEIFNDCTTNGVLCEYNLTTPLQKEILDIAIQKTDVNFVISTDMHDFRSLATRRIIDAWSESLGGGFEAAKKYLDNLLQLECGQSQWKDYSEKYKTNELLTALQNKVYLRSKGIVNEKTNLDNDEAEIFAILEMIPECEVDKTFFARRFERFQVVSSDRVTSLLDVAEFKSQQSIRRQNRSS